VRTLVDFEYDGLTALGEVIAQSEFGSVVQAVASLSIFSHPDTVAQTKNKALFPIIRDFKKRGTVGMVDGRLVGFDDNWSPTAAFMWSNGIKKRPRDVQFNHVYALSDDPDSYTALTNVIASPAFLAKLTDTNDEVKAALQYRVYDLYGWVPVDVPLPSRPEAYNKILWADPLPGCGNLRAVILGQLQRRPKDRITAMIKATGWLWGEAEGGNDANA